ncbi:MAG: hypothetical protein Ct9H300mP28_00010 [Pseudomonadota bacterium]|nr:MAG: hypothetical protein Ct9H300mP28_00010 [Pseudomonadota bacterium]
MITYALFFSYSNAGSTNCSEFDIPDAEVFLYPSLLSYHEANQLFDTLKKKIFGEKNRRLIYMVNFMMSQDLRMVWGSE